MKKVIWFLFFLILPVLLAGQGVWAHHDHDHDHDHNHHENDHDHGHDHEDRKKGILLAHFGSSLDQAQPALDNFEELTQEAYPEVPVRWAYTSRIVRHKLAEDGEHYDSVAMALARMEDEGFTHVAVQSLHTIPGKEFHDLRSVVSAFQDMENNFERLSLGAPLLNTHGELVQVRDEMLQAVPADRDSEEAVIWVGHGTYHPSNAFYVALKHKLQEKDENVYLATLECLEGSPAFDEVKEKVKAKGVQKVYLMPFMSVVGVHTLHDVAGEGDNHDHGHDHDHNHDHGHDHDHDHNHGHGHDHDHDHGDPFKERLEQAGIETEVVLKGTGEYDALVQLWLDRLDHALHELK